MYICECMYVCMYKEKFYLNMTQMANEIKFKK